MIEFKNCKGINKAKDFKGCGKSVLSQTRQAGLCKSCYTNWLISDDPKAVKIRNQAIIKGRKNLEKEKRKEHKEKKEKLKTLSDFKNDLQKEINTIVRLIDNGWGCIATGTKNGKMNAGHYISVGSNDTIRFHLENIWLQSEHSNQYKSGDTLRYQEGITLLYGKEYLNRLNSLKSIPPIKLTKEEIKDKISIARGIIKWLKLQDRMFTKEERISMRSEFNSQLGIYEEKFCVFNIKR